MSNEPAQELTLDEDEAVASHRQRNRLVRRGLFVCAAITVLTTLAIFWVLFNEATHFFFDRRFSGIVSSLVSGGDVSQRITFQEFFFGGERWDPTHAINPGYWVVPLLWGTLMITVGAALVSIPIGTLTALYLSEYASPRVRKYLKPGLEVLAGIPTIVYRNLVPHAVADPADRRGVRSADSLDKRDRGSDRRRHHDDPDCRLDQRGRNELGS